MRSVHTRKSRSGVVKLLACCIATMRQHVNPEIRFSLVMAAAVQACNAFLGRKLVASSPRARRLFEMKLGGTLLLLCVNLAKG